jgi:glucose dehydrogenase
MAREAVRAYRLGPLFTPPSREGTVTLPGVIGGAGWGGGAFDPVSGLYYVKANNSPARHRLAPPARSGTNDAAFAFVAQTGGEALITSAEAVGNGEAGTRVRRL